MHGHSGLVCVALGLLLLLAILISQEVEAAAETAAETAAAKGRNRKKKVFMYREDCGANVSRLDGYDQLWNLQRAYSGWPEPDEVATNLDLLVDTPAGQNFVYQTWLQGTEFIVSISVRQAGYYMVSLRFAEMVATAPGVNVFDVYAVDVMNNPQLQNFDIFAAAGGSRLPVTRDFDVYCDKIFLHLRFTAIKGLAQISGIVIRQSVRPLKVWNAPQT